MRHGSVLGADDHEDALGRLLRLNGDGRELPIPVRAEDNTIHPRHSDLRVRIMPGGIDEARPRRAAGRHHEHEHQRHDHEKTLLFQGLPPSS